MILASASPRRQQLMREANLTFRVIPSGVDEHAISAPEPQELVQLLASAKARSVADQAAPGETVIASDTVVVLEGRVLGKPQDAAEAARMLRALSGRTHTVMTGVCILSGARERTFVECTDVTFYELEEGEIAAYIATGEPMDKAGAYGIQGLGRLMIRGIQGDYYTVVGLPIARLVRELRAMGLTE